MYIYIYIYIYADFYIERVLQETLCTKLINKESPRLYIFSSRGKGS